MVSPTNWIVKSNELVHMGDRVALLDRRTGVIVRVSTHGGRPVVRMDDNSAEISVHPMEIGRKLP